jgi:methylglutaconyl-CoA hydratase
MSHYSTLRMQNDSGLTTILLNRAEKRNALTPQLIEELTQALESCAANSHCHVIALTGAGSAFCAGLDLEHLRAMVPDPQQSPHAGNERYRAEAEAIANLYRVLYSLPKPTIAAVNGPAVAGGMGLATLCDFTLAVPEAKFGYTEVRIGFIPAIVSAFLRRQIGDKGARDLLLTGRILSAEEAHALGLVTRIVPEPELMQEVRSLAARLMRNSPAAMEATKRLLGRFDDRFLPDDLEAAIRANLEARFHDDFREGVTAFLEKRDPRWPSLHKGSKDEPRER